jgi:hypothetical protein
LEDVPLLPGHRLLVSKYRAMDLLSSRALAAALEVARTHGVRVREPAVLRDRANLMVHLRPSPVVARIATTTALVRPSAAEFLARDLSVASFLASQGAPVVPPSREILPGPHACGGFTMTFWEFTPHHPDPARAATSAEAGSLLQQLHALLKNYPGELPYLNPVLGEIPRFLAYLERRGELEPADLARLRSSKQELAQALHGDAHQSNLLRDCFGRTLKTPVPARSPGTSRVLPATPARPRRWPATRRLRAAKNSSLTAPPENCRVFYGLPCWPPVFPKIEPGRGKRSKAGRSRAQRFDPSLRPPRWYASVIVS